jgi:hypothetical protein
LLHRVILTLNEDENGINSASVDVLQPRIVSGLFWKEQLKVASAK